MGETELLITIILYNLFFILFIISVLVYIKRYKERKNEYLKELQHTNEEHQKEILKTQLEIQQSTMAEIGRELHDNIGQKLTLASLYSQQLIFENKAPQINNKIEEVTHIIDESIEVLRGLSKSLTDDRISKKNIIELIEEEVKKINKLKKCNVIFLTNFTLLDLKFIQKSVLLRIVQESIQNSLKHSQCTEIIIELNQTNNDIELSIKDNGKGFDTQNSQFEGIGLQNMRKRIEMLNGTFNMVSAPNKGTRILTLIKQKR